MTHHPVPRLEEPSQSEVARLRHALERVPVLVLIVLVTCVSEATAVHGAASMEARSLPKKESAVVVQA
jgi:hypothetical protein